MPQDCYQSTNCMGDSDILIWYPKYDFSVEHFAKGIVSEISSLLIMIDEEHFIKY